MRENEQETHASIGLPDIYYVLFRHKWKILGLSLAGIVAAMVLFFAKPAVYRSEAKLFVRYVQDTRLPAGMGENPSIKSPDSRGDNVINSEAEVLTSLDLALQVVDAVGADKILAKLGGGNDRYMAAGVIRQNLAVEVPKKSDILKVVYQHPDREVVQQVLLKLLNFYQKKHVEIHRTPGAIDDALAQQTDSARTKLAATEDELKLLKKKLGIDSLDDSKKAGAEQKGRLQVEIMNAEADYAQRNTALTNLQKATGSRTNVAAAPDVVTPPEIINEYKMLGTRLDGFRRREQELMTSFSDENVLLKDLRAQIAASEKFRNKLLIDYPKLEKVADTGSKANVSTAPDMDAEQAALVALKVRIDTLKSQLTNVTTALAAVTEAEPQITQLERRRKLEEAQYNYYYSNLQQARFDATLVEGKLTNISVAEQATPPFRDASQALKLPMIVLVCGILGGLLFAFVLEFYLDTTIKRPIEVETKLKLPLFLSIPHASELNGKNGHLQLKDGDGGATVQVNGSDAVAPWDEGHSLRAFGEALRDRLVTYFEVRNLTHKPKLVAVTGCSSGAGVTTLAAGLAATLSETGDGNVLLVDMNVQNGAAHPFFKGKPSCALADALEGETREDAMVNNNLYVASGGRNANGDKLPRILPKRFSQLMPKLKASDYDYIIFDMPPVSQTSVTARLSTYMDMTLLVLESEKTDREIVKRATALLSESKANVTAILNKTHNYVPRRLHQEFLSNA